MSEFFPPIRAARFAASTSRRGFTLVELMVVVVVIGILATIAIPKFWNTKAKAHFAGMQSDLHNLATAEEGYFYDHSTYTLILDSLHYSMSPSDAVVVVEATIAGWSATATNAESSPHFCAMFTGSAAPIAPATSSGQVACQ